MKKIAFALITAWMVMAGPCLAADVIPLLKISSGTFSNVTVLNVTDTHLFFKYDGGEGSAKLKDLDPQLQKEFGYDPIQAAHFEQQYQKNQTALAESPKSGEAFNALGETARKHMAADEVVARDFRLDGGTKLRLTYPKFWVRTSDKALGEMPTIQLLHPFPDSFQVQIRILPKDNLFAKMGTFEAVSIPCYQARRGAVETNASVVAIEGPNANGHYFAITRKNPGKGAPALCQGIVKLGEKLILFSVQCEDCKSAEADAVIEMMRTAEFIAADTAKNMP